jgi:hypothetical protein
MKRLIIAAALILFMVGICSAETLTIQNCTPGTMVDGVKWTDETMSDYTDVDLLTHNEIKSFDVGPGLYALTHYKPREVIQYQGKYVVTPGVILEFIDNVDVRVNEHLTINFGCK